MTHPSTTSLPLQTLPAALIKLVKLIKTVRYYPPGHPALQEIGQTTLQVFLPLLQAGNLILQIRKDAFLLDETPVGQDLPAVKSLAHFLFARRVQRLMFMQDLSVRDLNAFARCVALQPAAIQQQGGLQELLLTEQVTGLWVNEIDLRRIQAERDRIADQQNVTGNGAGEAPQPDDATDSGIESGSGIEGPDQDWNSSLEEILADQLSFEQLLSQLPNERSEQRFRILLRKLALRVRPFLTEEGLPKVLAAFRTLATILGNRDISVGRRNEVVQTLAQLSDGPLLLFLVDSLCRRDCPRALREEIIGVLASVQERAVPLLCQRLATEENAQARKLLATALVQQGPKAVPELLGALRDHRWYVVRNAVSILGQIGDARVVPQLRLCLNHADDRIVREAIRALGQLGGSQAARSLLPLLEGGSPDLIGPVTLALGAIRHPVAVPALTAIVKQPDWLGKRVALKAGVIKALGRIAEEEAVPCLIRQLRSKGLWRRKKQETLRVLAAQALGEIRCDASRAALKAAIHDRVPRISHAARQALAHWPEE